MVLLNLKVKIVKNFIAFGAPLDKFDLFKLINKLHAIETGEIFLY